MFKNEFVSFSKKLSNNKLERIPLNQTNYKVKTSGRESANETRLLKQNQTPVDMLSQNSS